jgi:hypothetical protein
MTSIKLIVGAVVISMLFGIVIGSTLNDGQQYLDNYDEDYYTVSLYKDNQMLTLPSRLEDGQQYDYLLVEDFLSFDEDGFRQDDTVGFLRVNETTNKIEFREITMQFSGGGRVVEIIFENDTYFEKPDVEFDMSIKVRMNKTHSFNYTGFRWLNLWWLSKQPWFKYYNAYWTWYYELQITGILHLERIIELQLNELRMVLND